MPTRQLHEWTGEFGTAYTERNDVDWRTRVEPFKKMIGGLTLRGVLEVGCNRGHNLVALHQILGDEVDVVGVEPNPHALRIARQSSPDIAALRGTVFDLPFKDNTFDLVFTSGVLIHVAPADLPGAMREIVRVAARYILAVEYYAATDTQVEYRGHADLLWKADYCRRYLDILPSLRVVDSGYWEPNGPINDANWWLLEKTEAPPATVTAAAVIQARMGSTRLPGKVLLDIGGDSMLGRVVTRSRRATAIAEVWVATTTESGDDPIEDVCRQRSWPCFRGSEADVLDRYWALGRSLTADAIVRITADCPLIDPGVIDAAVALFHDTGADYATTSDWFPRGLDVEVMSPAALETAWRQATAPHERTHVTPYFYEHPEAFHVATLPSENNYSAFRWTVDTDADLEFARAVFAALGDAAFTWLDVLELVRRHPEMAALNAHVRQKDVFEL